MEDINNKNPINLLGISGYSGSGKDTVGKIIQDLTIPEREVFENGLVSKAITFSPFAIKKFSYKLKFGLEYDFPNEFNEFLWESSGKEYRDGIMKSLGISRRKALQLRGEKMREINENYWVNALFADYKPDLDLGFTVKWDSPLEENLIYRDAQGKKYVAKYPNWIITDCRFKNEAQAIVDKGGIVIRVSRHRVKPNSQEKVILHKSETDLDLWKFDYHLNNNGTIEELSEDVAEMLKTLKII